MNFYRGSDNFAGQVVVGRYFNQVNLTTELVEDRRESRDF